MRGVPGVLPVKSGGGGSVLMVLRESSEPIFVEGVQTKPVSQGIPGERTVTLIW